MKYILMDVEGTTTSISFVHETLFPYSQKHLREFIQKNKSDNRIQKILAETRQSARDEESIELDEEGVIQQLLEWIKIDRKHKALKQLQGLIWKEGYSSGELKGHVYQDVPANLKAWEDKGLRLGIYSSGSVEAQRALFGHSLFGNLNPYFSHHFDTTVGHKRDFHSYENILTQINEKGSDVLFLSDIAEELDAAKASGIHTIQLVRLQEMPFVGHQQIRSFDEISL